MRSFGHSCRAFVLALATLLGVLLATGPAKAQSPGTGAAPYILFVVPGVVADIVFTTYDLRKAIGKEPAGQGMAIAEIAVVGPQLLLGGLVLFAPPEAVEKVSETQAPAVILYTVWVGALTAHGISTLIARTAPAPNAPRDAAANERRLTLTPALLGSASRTVPGLVAFGRF